MRERRRHERHQGHRGDRQLADVVRRRRSRGGGVRCEVDPRDLERGRDERDVRRRAGRDHALERARQDLVPRRAALNP